MRLLWATVAIAVALFLNEIRILLADYAVTVAEKKKMKIAEMVTIILFILTCAIGFLVLLRSC